MVTSFLKLPPSFINIIFVSKLIFEKSPQTIEKSEQFRCHLNHSLLLAPRVGLELPEGTSIFSASHPMINSHTYSCGTPKYAFCSLCRRHILTAAT